MTIRDDLRRYNQLGWYGLYDLRDKLWLGEDAGVVTFSDRLLAEAARDVARIRLRWQIGRIEVRVYDGNATRLRDEQPNHMSAAKALRRIVSGEVP
jgi:hypothetical protein